MIAQVNGINKYDHVMIKKKGIGKQIIFNKNTAQCFFSKKCRDFGHKIKNRNLEWR